MTEEIKYLVFKGIEKKEQILFKSFLNLSKNELDYKVVVLKGDVDSATPVDVVIADDSYEFLDGESDMKSLPTVLVGDDLMDDRFGYLSRPVQWSDFRSALAIFSASESVEQDVSESVDLSIDEVPLLEVESDSSLSQSDSQMSLKPKLELVLDDDEEGDELDVQAAEPDRVLPAEVMFAIDDEPSEEDLDDSDSDFAPIDHEFELDNLSVDYASHTNSDYMKVVDDVQQFKDDDLGDGLGATDAPAMLLVTDDESNSTNSVLVIETNSLDAWDFSVTEQSSEIEEAATDAKEAVAGLEPVAFDGDGAVPKGVQQKAGFALVRGEEYWLADNEIIANDVTVLYVKHQRSMVYSASEPGLWINELQDKKLSKLPLKADWRPKKGLVAYPLSHLVWVNSLISETKALASGLDDDAEYLLEAWPHFDLLQLDNVLLKLCSMMFVNPESLTSLVEKSGYSRSTIRGLMNACFQAGLLKKPNEIQVENLVSSDKDGVFGKIKDVFR